MNNILCPPIFVIHILHYKAWSLLFRLKTSEQIFRYFEANRIFISNVELDMNYLAKFDNILLSMQLTFFIY